MSENKNRKLASIQRITEIKDIDQADRIQAYRVNNWWCVASKEQFSVGDLIVYIEIDSWVSNELFPALSNGKEPKTYLGLSGERLTTRKFKKQISQGLILPVSICSNIESELTEGLDLTYPLGIIKWEAPEEFVSADAKGKFPAFIPKTAQERLQNLTNDFSGWLVDKSMWQKTEKVHGTSLTVFVNGEEYGVCSRNLELKEDETNTYWRIVKSYDLINKIKSTGRNLAFQGEGYGYGISGNLYKLQDQRFMLYNIFDIKQGAYLLPQEAYTLCKELGVPHVPLVCVGTIVGTIQELLEDADGMSGINPSSIREGYVYKHMKSNLSFKVVSNTFLIRHE